MIKDDWRTLRDVAAGAVTEAGRAGAFRWLARVAAARGWRDAPSIALLAIGIALA